MPDDKPNLTDLKKPKAEATAPILTLTQEAKLAIYTTASQVYLRQRPEIAQGSLPKPPKDANDTEGAQAYQKGVETHLMVAQHYGIMEAKALWTNLFGESFTSPIDQKGVEK